MTFITVLLCLVYMEEETAKVTPLALTRTETASDAAHEFINAIFQQGKQ